MLNYQRLSIHQTQTGVPLGSVSPPTSHGGGAAIGAPWGAVADLGDGQKAGTHDTYQHGIIYIYIYINMCIYIYQSILGIYICT